MENKIQNRERAGASDAPSGRVLDYCNQIPTKLRSFLEQVGLSQPTDIYNFLQPKISDLENPYKILNCEKACERLWTAWINQETVLVYGDYDLDGTSGIALLYDSFKALGYKNLYYFQPSKANDGYGLHAPIIEKFKTENNIDLVVTVDVGITGNVACDKATELGVDVIVTDHHLAQDKLPNAYTIVNPNQPDDQSGMGYLCGCGVAFYLIRGLCKKFIEKGTSVSLDLKSVLPYFAIATVTDMVPIIKDNRSLLKFAFEAFRSVNNMGLKALMEELKLANRKLNASDIGLTLAPKINAISRMSSAIKPIDLLFQKNDLDAKTFAKEILKLNVERKRLQEEGLKEVKIAFEQYQKNNSVNPESGHHVFFYSSVNIHHGVTGLIASKMVENFGGSFFIGAYNESTGIIVGSSRKSDKVAYNVTYSLVDMMAAGKEHWLRFGGHACAAGFEYVKENEKTIWESSQKFLNKLNMILSTDTLSLSQPKTSGFNPIDLDWFDLNTHFFSWVQFLEPFGNQFPEPIFRLKSVPIFSIKKMKEIHFKLNVVNPQNRESLNFVLFNSSEEQRQMLSSLNREFDICFKIKKDNFNYNQQFQFIIESLTSMAFKDSEVL